MRTGERMWVTRADKATEGQSYRQVDVEWMYVCGTTGALRLWSTEYHQVALWVAKEAYYPPI